MRRLNPKVRPYSVEMTARAWTHIGTVPAEVFQEIRSTLEVIGHQLASREDALGSEPPLPDSSHSLQLDGFVAFYAVSPAARTITLLEIARSLRVSP